MNISRILHAGYLFKSGETRILFDPIFENPFSRNCYAFPQIEFDLEQIKCLKFSAVFISHFHDDHFSMESLNLLDRNTPIYMYCLHEEIFELIRELGFNEVHSLRLNRFVEIGHFKVTARRALDVEVDCLLQIEAEGLNILNVVDSWIDEQTLNVLQNQKPWDLILWPFQTLRETEILTPSKALPPEPHLPPEWIHQLRILHPRYVVPSSCQFIHESWSWYNHALFPVSYNQFTHEIELALGGDTKVIRFEPSISMNLNATSISNTDSLPWIKTVGERNEDYHFFAGAQAPPTSDIAQNFSALTRTQAIEVENYCLYDLLLKLKSRVQTFDPYFSVPLTWRLILYNHLGHSQIYNYRINGEQTEIADFEDQTYDWLTEVPIAKLHAAIKEGEALTSMYLRVNDVDFAPRIESKIRAVDVLEDPLIRCLFDGELGSYQKAQMKRLKLFHS